ncbi:hypothetical protein B484DRAFT_440242, partial [Ochromonadaceae sp. CCMP2298]
MNAISPLLLLLALTLIALCEQARVPYSEIDLADLATNDVQAVIVQGAVSNDRLGRSVSAAGDVNNDGIADVIVGAPQYSSGGRSSAGAAFVIFGNSSGLVDLDLLGFVSGTRGFIIQGATAGGLLGQSVSGAGDVNGDGNDDVIVSAPYAPPEGRTVAGAVYVIWGKGEGFATLDLLGFVSGDSTGFIIQGAMAGDNLGWSVGAAGDVNNDGYADVIVGAPRADPEGRSSAGAVYVILGKGEGFATVDLLGFVSGTRGFIIQGAKVNHYLGYSVSGAGDVNGD